MRSKIRSRIWWENALGYRVVLECLPFWRSNQRGMPAPMLKKDFIVVYVSTEMSIQLIGMRTWVELCFWLPSLTGKDCRKVQFWRNIILDYAKSQLILQFSLSDAQRWFESANLAVPPLTNLTESVVRCSYPSRHTHTFIGTLHSTLTVSNYSNQW